MFAYFAMLERIQIEMELLFREPVMAIRHRQAYNPW